MIAEPRLDSDTPVLAAISRRRSVSPRRLVAPGPNEEQLHRLIEAAVAAPDYGRVRPWCFVVIRERDRASMASVFADAMRELEPGIAEGVVKQEAAKVHGPPCLIAVIARIDESHLVASPSEQWISVGASIQNILLAAEALGFRGSIVSGRKVESDTMRRAFRLRKQDHLVGFVAIGNAGSEPPAVARTGVQDVLTIWNGDYTRSDSAPLFKRFLRSGKLRIRSRAAFHR